MNCFPEMAKKSKWVRRIVGVNTNAMRFHFSFAKMSDINPYGFAMYF
jgi:hypothetical protein